MESPISLLLLERRVLCKYYAVVADNVNEKQMACFTDVIPLNLFGIPDFLT